MEESLEHNDKKKKEEKSNKKSVLLTLLTVGIIIAIIGAYSTISTTNQKVISLQEKAQTDSLKFVKINADFKALKNQFEDLQDTVGIYKDSILEYKKLHLDIQNTLAVIDSGMQTIKTTKKMQGQIWALKKNLKQIKAILPGIDSVKIAKTKSLETRMNTVETKVAKVEARVSKFEQLKAEIKAQKVEVKQEVEEPKKKKKSFFKKKLPGAETL